MSSRYERLLFKTGKTSRNPFITRTSSFLWKMKPTGRSINNSAVRQEYVVKRRSRIDLGNQHVKKSDNEGRDAGLLQEAVSSTSQQDDNSLPTKFGKKYVRRDNRMPKYLRGEGSSDRTERRPVIDPFDICLPNSSKSSVQITMSLENNMEQDSEIEYPIIETRQILRPGMILLTNYISLGEQVEIINKCRELGVGPGGFYQPGYQDGAKLRLRMMCLGKKWDPETKYEEQIRSDDSEPLGIPAEFVLLVERALSDSHALIKKHRAASNVEEIFPGMIPDICIVNFYTTNGKLGLHQVRRWLLSLYGPFDIKKKKNCILLRIMKSNTVLGTFYG